MRRKPTPRQPPTTKWNDRQFRALVTASSSVLYRMNADWSVMQQLGSRGFLANTDEPTASWLEKYIPAHERPRVLAAIEGAVRNRSVFELEHQVVREDGTLGWTLSRAVPVIGADGEVTEWFGAADDVTARREADEQRGRALAEKETLLKEVHHRVKNSLQVVDSLLRLMADTFPDGRLRQVVADAANRVHVIGEVHQLLYQGPSLAEVDMSAFVQRLCAFLSTMDGPASAPRIDVQVGLSTLDARRAVPVGQILNELICNALRHAFAPGQSRTIHVDLHQKDGSIVMRVRDDGDGLPEPLPSGTFGLQLVRILTEQLHGELQFEVKGGTSVTVRFPVESPEG